MWQTPDLSWKILEDAGSIFLLNGLWGRPPERVGDSSKLPTLRWSFIFSFREFSLKFVELTVDHLPHQKNWEIFLQPNAGWVSRLRRENMCEILEKSVSCRTHIHWWLYHKHFIKTSAGPSDRKKSSRLIQAAWKRWWSSVLRQEKTTPFLLNQRIGKQVSWYCIPRANKPYKFFASKMIHRVWCHWWGRHRVCV